MAATDQEIPAYPFSPPQRLDTDPRYTRLREEQPLVRVHMPYGGDAWIATRYEDVRTVLADQRFSRAETVGRDVPRVFPLIQYDPSILGMDPPEHTRLRTVVTKAFTVRRVDDLKPRIQEIIDGLVDAMIDSGSPADLTQALAWPLPIVVICELLGVPVEDRDRFRHWTDLMVALGGVDHTEIDQARIAMNEYLGQLIEKRKVEPTDDLLGQLVQGKEKDDRLSDIELITFGVTLLIAGHETTANQTGNFVYLLLQDRTLWDSLVAEPDLVPAAVEELMRYVPLAASAGFARMATEDVQLGGQLVRKGDAVFAELNSANRDAGVFDHPDEIDFHRPNNQHVGFGHGVHHCLGAPLARLELRMALGTLVRRLPGLRLAVPADEVVFRADRLVRGATALPVAW